MEPWRIQSLSSEVQMAETQAEARILTSIGMGPWPRPNLLAQVLLSETKTPVSGSRTSCRMLPHARLSRTHALMGAQRRGSATRPRP